MQPVGVESFRRFQQRRDLFGQARLDRLRLAAGRGLGLVRQTFDFIHALLQNLPERLAFATAHLDQLGKRLLEAFGRRIARRLVLGLVAFGFGDLDDALDGEQSVDAGRHRIDATGEFARDLHDRGEHVFIDVDGRHRVGALDAEIGVDRAARQHLTSAFLGQGFQFVPAWRQAQAEVKPLGIDGLQFPFERVRPAGAVTPGKAGHAR